MANNMSLPDLISIFIIIAIKNKAPITVVSGCIILIYCLLILSHFYFDCWFFDAGALSY